MFFLKIHIFVKNNSSRIHPRVHSEAGIINCGQYLNEFGSETHSSLWVDMFVCAVELLVHEVLIVQKNEFEIAQKISAQKTYFSHFTFQTAFRILQLLVVQWIPYRTWKWIKDFKLHVKMCVESS